MTAYIIVEAVIHDPEKFAAYARLVPGIVAEQGGEYLVLGGQQEALEGDWGARVWSCIAGPLPSRLARFGIAMPMLPPNHSEKARANFASCWSRDCNKHLWSNVA